MRPAFRTGLRWVLLAIPLWLGVMHLPAPVSIEIFDARPMAQDYAVRHGLGLGTALPSAAGPLGALLTGVHSGQPLWLNYWCQSLVGLAFALGLSWIVWRTAPPARWWLLGALFIVASFRAEYMHLTLLLLGGMMLINRPVPWLEATGMGSILGLLALSDVHCALFALAAIALSRTNPAPVSARLAPLAAGAAFVAVFLGGWFWTGQPAGGLLPWLGHGLVPAALRHQATAQFWSGPVFACGVLTGLLAAVLLAGTVLASPQRWRTLAAAGYVTGILAFVWLRATGQPEVGPRPFFATALMAGLGWLALEPYSRRLRLAAMGTVIAGSLGLLLVEPRILTEAIMLLNQKMVANAAALADRRGWQRALNDSFQSTAQLFALPRIKAATAGQRTGFLGNPVGYALVNRLDYAPHPGLQGFRVADAALAASDAAFFAGPAAPAFVVQRLQAFDRGLTALEDAPAQLALYAAYDFQFEENGFALWQRRAAAAGPVVAGAPVWQTKAGWNTPVALPVRPDHAYWLTIRLTRSFTGGLKYRLLPPADPTLVLRDREGGVLSYRAAPLALGTGFLLNPLFRGEIDLIRYQAGERLPAIQEIVLRPPAGADGDFTGTVEISLHEVAAPAVSGRKESAEDFARRFRIANRLPVAVAAYYPPQTTRLEQQDVLLAHPDSSLEFPVRADDTRLQGGFGLLAGAYQNGNATDGVEFVAEYVPASGPPAILWRRHLDPVTQAGDRGPQQFSLDLPPPASGRIILRTQNLPGHNAAWDWSFWTDLRFSSSPATK